MIVDAMLDVVHDRTPHCCTQKGHTDISSSCTRARGVPKWCAEIAHRNAHAIHIVGCITKTRRAPNREQSSISSIDWTCALPASHFALWKRTNKPLAA